MTTLKSKIRIIPSLPNTTKKENKKTKLLTVLFLIIIIFLGGFAIYKIITPYLFAVNIKHIIGKQTTITECNTKDYIIINKNKTFSMKLTDNNCKINNYEGTITIKYNEIIFKNKLINNNTLKEKNNIIKGTINESTFNIIINNKTFESDKNE